MSTDFPVTLGLPVVLVALAALVGGAAWFSDAYRSLRLRRAYRDLRTRSLDELRDGLVRVRGKVSLAGPLFSPLGGRPCAGFVLEAHGVGSEVRGSVRELRAFELRDGDQVARVDAARGEWALPVSREREFAPGEALGANLEALLDRHPELAWLRRRGGGLRLVERALHHQAQVEVIAWADRAHEAAHAEVYEEQLRTGTDGGAVARTFASAVTEFSEPVCDWRLSDADGLPLQLIAAGAPAQALRVPSIVRTWGVTLGPVLALAGLLVLARLAGSVMAVR